MSLVAIGGGISVRDALESAQTAIGAAGSDTPRLDAELLLAHVLGVSRERLLIDRDLEVRGAAVRDYQLAVTRRARNHEPVAYIIGRRAFRDLELAVDRRALIPRPETELLVDVALDLAPGARVLDVGTGSGAVALAIKHERPDLAVTGSDVSAAALTLARENAERLGIEGITWRNADLLAGLPDAYDAILSNPPYVADSDRAMLAPEITRHEPPEALFAGPDGLDVIRSLIAQAARRSAARRLAIEVGAGQAREVIELARQAGFREVRAPLDLAGIPRVVVADR